MKIKEAALPGWAWDILTAEEWRYRLPDIQIVWRVSRKRGHPQTSGTAFPLTFRIVINAGTDERDQRLMLLHEISHIVVGPGHGHDAPWSAVFESLHARYGLTAYAAERDRLLQFLASPEVRRLLSSYESGRTPG